jgi:hypothetical protein
VSYFAAFLYGFAPWREVLRTNTHLTQRGKGAKFSQSPIQTKFFAEPPHRGRQYFMKTPLILTGLTIVLFSCFSVVSAQKKPAKSKPDFNGTWLLDLKKTDQKALPTRPDLPLRISHHDPELRIIQTSEVSGKTVERESVYYTDERGETNQAITFLTTNPGSVKPSDLEKQVTKSRTRWSGDKLVTVSTLRLRAAGHVIEYELVDEWKISSDGKVLTKISKVTFQGSNATFVPAIVPDTKRVYNRT